MTTSTTPATDTRWYCLEPDETVRRLDSDASGGLTSGEASARLERYGANELEAEPPPSLWAVALVQLRDPMNLMLVAVTVVSGVIGQWSTAILVGVLVVMNVVLGARRELQARASVDALAKLQVPQARVVRDGSLVQIPAPEVVPGDIVNVEAGDLVPADGRLLRASSLEVQEAALTGESAPVGKATAALPDEELTVGDRENLLFQNTSVTRGSGTIVVTATGMSTEMGRIAEMLTAVKRTRSPLQRELDSLTKVLGSIAWGAVALIVVVGLLRGLSIDEVLLVGTAMAISAIPTGLPTFVQGMLSYGAKQLAEEKAIVKNLSDVETLGSTSAINTDKTGTLTMNEMMARVVYFREGWYTVEGAGYEKRGAILGVAGAEVPDFTPLAYGLALDSDATVADDGTVVGDPTEAALVVLAAKVGVDAEETRRAYPRVAEVPFDSDYKFMATFHHLPIEGETRLVELVKGAPDVVLARCSESVGPGGAVHTIDETRDEIESAYARMSERGLRVLAFAARFLDDGDLEAVRRDPMAMVENLRMVALVGIIDPLRPEAKRAVEVASAAGIDVRMITGDHAITAQAIGEELGLGPGAISGTDFGTLTDEEVLARLPELHVFGRVAPEDKLRLVRLMQEAGMIVAMTGDAVNDAAALKQADIGVAMGSGSEVSKQAAKMILTDDNFGTLVRAIELGRGVYEKIVSYIRYQMSQLLSLVLLFLAATIFNINSGVALTPAMVLFLNFFISIGPVMAIVFDPTGAGIMNRKPRDPSVGIANPRAISRWALYGGTLFLASLAPLVWGPDQPLLDAPSAAMTMSFVVMGLGTVFSGIVMRREPESGLEPPILGAVRVLSVPALLMALTTEVGFLQRFLGTQPLTAGQWGAALALGLALPLVVETDKAIRRRSRTVPQASRESASALAGSRAA